MLTADRPHQRFVIRPDRDYLLYLPPRDGEPYSVLSTRTEYPRGNRLALSVEDPNTLRVRADLRHCGRIRIRFDDDRVVDLLPEGCPP